MNSFVLIVAECNVNQLEEFIISEFKRVLIVAECNVNGKINNVAEKGDVSFNSSRV